MMHKPSRLEVVEYFQKTARKMKKRWNIRKSKPNWGALQIFLANMWKRWSREHFMTRGGTWTAVGTLLYVFHVFEIDEQEWDIAKRMTDGEGLHVIEGYSLAEVHDQGMNHG